MCLRMRGANSVAGERSRLPTRANPLHPTSSVAAARYIARSNGFALSPDAMSAMRK